jgi:serine/threonine-protein kinase
VTTYQFDDLSIDVGQRQVSRGDEQLDVSGLTFDLLLAIAEAAPNIVSSDELVDKVWSGRPASPETITQRTMMLRQALGDDADNPKYVEVIRGQGLKLIPELAGTSAQPEPRPVRVSKTHLTGIVAAIGVLAIVFISKDYIGSGISIDEATAPAPVRRYPMDIGALESITDNGAGLRSDIALSPDGSRLAYVARYSGDSTTRLFLREMSKLDAQVIEGTEGARHPFFSPDGEWIGFDAAETSIQKVSVRGGLRKTLIDGIYRMYGASWSEDGSIVYSTTTQADNQTGKLVRISANGGAPEDLLVATDGTSYRWPHFLPGGESLLFSIREQGFSFGDGDVGLLSLESGEHRTLIPGGYNPRYSPTGHIVFTRGDTVWAVPFDVASGEITGEESPLFDGLEHNSGPGAAIYDFSDDGLLVYLLGDDVNLGGNQDSRYPVWVDREGNEEPINVASANYWGPRISPDGKQAVVTVNDAGNNDIWIIDLERDTSTRLTLGENYEGRPFWSPDGNRIIYQGSHSQARANGRGIYSMAANGTGSADLINTNEVATNLDAVSPDGEHIIALDSNRGESDMYVLSLVGESFPQPYVATAFDEESAEISPDGNYVAYVSDETGQDEIYVRTFPNPDVGRWRVSTDGGYEPKWNPDGNELFFHGDGSDFRSIFVVDIKTQPDFSTTQPRLVLSTDHVFIAGYAVSVDGERFLMFKNEIQPSEAATGGARASRLAIVENWFEELKRIRPTEPAE